MANPRLSCPLCGQPAMTAWGKMWLALHGSTFCASCHRAVGVSWSLRMLADAPLLAGLLLTLGHGPLAMGMGIGLGAVVTSCAHLLWVPLIPRANGPMSELRKENDVDWCQQFFASAGGAILLMIGLAEGGSGGRAHLVLGLVFLGMGIVHAVRWRRKKQVFERNGPTGTNAV